MVFVSFELCGFLPDRSPLVSFATEATLQLLSQQFASGKEESFSTVYDGGCAPAQLLQPGVFLAPFSFMVCLISAASTGRPAAA